MPKLFGTDGIRGIANEKMTANLAFNLGKAFGIILNETSIHKKVLIGRDTRISGQMLSSAFCAGLNSVGFSALIVGVLPTPATSYLTKILDVDGGVMITASHNPAEYNGIKFYDSLGNKLDKNTQNKIEELITNLDSFLYCPPHEVGTQEYNEDLTKLWVDHIIKTSQIKSLNGLKIALDTANGASFAVAPYIFKKLNAKTFIYNDSDDGKLINLNCGSQHTEKFIENCIKNDVDFGFSFDGDADRVIAVGKNGKIFDGTDLMFIFANYLKSKNQLNSNTVVSTIVTNCGLENSLQKDDITLIRTNVGGIYIQTKMQELSLSLGGEENGHIMLSEFGAESDGISTALFLLKIAIDENFSIEDTLSNLTRTLVKNSDIPVSERQKQLVESGELQDFVTELEKDLDNSGRIVVRTSGTEPLVRILVEGEDEEKLENLNHILAQKVKNL